MPPIFDLLLFVDDNEATNYYHNYIIQDANVCKESIFFQMAEDALDWLKNLKDIDAFPDIIFLDINMPRMDGWEFLDKYLELDLPIHSNIYLLSTSRSQKDIARAEEHKLVSNIYYKPLEIERLKRIANERMDN